MLIGILGVLKAGGAYVPLDPSTPKERLSFIIEDSKIAYIITRDYFVKNLPGNEINLICMDSYQDRFGLEKTKNPERNLTSKNLAYIIYTSGSTGKPKGVAVQHRSLTNYLSWVNTILFKKSQPKLPTITNISFDASLKQIFAPLLRGHPIWLIPDEVAENPKELLVLFKENRIIGINCVPYLWSAILDLLEIGKANLSDDTLTHLFLGGENFNREMIERTYSLLPKIKIWNLYGPTETTANAGSSNIEFGSEISIGQPIANTEFYILDRHLQPVPVGVPGVLYIGGECLARGYQNRPALTAETFIPNPYDDYPGSRLYNTGDKVRYLRDGKVKFIGRIDNQVKIRGFRIELGEIEAALKMVNGIKEVVVVSHGDDYLEKRLVSYVVPDSNHQLSIGFIRQEIMEKLPNYMIPSSFVILDRMPLGPTGKLDLFSLPQPEKSRSELGSQYIAPRSEIEEVLTELWGEILGFEQIGVQDNFFDLGGHSLMATMLVSRIKSLFPVPLTLRSLFQGPTIEEVANYLLANELQSGDVTKIARIIISIRDMTDYEIDKALLE